MKGLVTKSTGSWYTISTEGEQTINARVRGKLKLKGFKTTNPIAVGDFVEYIIENESENTGLITKIYARNNYIIRKSTQLKHQEHILASNIDQLMIVVALVFPRTSLGFIDRLSVGAESFRIPITIVFNKCDLLDEEGLEYQDSLVQLYTGLGMRCLVGSATEKIGLDAIQEVLKNKTTLIAGHSGVGKSTLLNVLHPEIEQKTGRVSDYAQKGTHTTTFAQMFEIEKDCKIIDTPGIKEYGMIDIDENELSDFFPEMRALLGACKFNNCTHTHEPGCAIVDAVQQGSIAESRYLSYLSILEGDDNRR